MIYQMHKDHGRHMPITVLEAQANEKNGWRTVTREEFYKEIQERQGQDTPVAEEPIKPNDAPKKKKRK